MVDIWNRLASDVPDIRLKVACSNTLYGLPEYDWVDQLKTKLLQMDRVVDLGILPHHQIVQEIRSSYLHLYPSMIPDTFGLGAIEALAGGTPTVAFNVGGNVGKLLNDTNGGRLVQPNSISNFIDEVKSILKDPTGWETMSIGGKSVLDSVKYDWKSVAAKWIQVLGG